ncbi:hypothetical protein H6P81_011164 [Aristolochia fimbriata]|uniref:Gfo/Idh/MocA-like oxidoreductase N-terminal domain-containing protein n=1 Tax=Aristolochia fimbriata TaxID=158543 RepID=A0AAV7ERG0_ARIFI|nr:hypothetical protein H6P81_011164 [Aristolochia fimbriata]
MAENRPVRFGIIGCADIARKVSRAISLIPNATISAVGSRRLEKAVKFAVDNNIPTSAKLYGSYDDVLDDPDVDAVYVPLPTSLHLRWAVLAAEKKKHVLLEKPVALHVTELDRILEVCEANRVQFMDGTMWLHNPRTRIMADILSDAERLGEIQSIHSTSSFTPPPEFFEKNIRVKPDLDALGALGDAGWYCIGAILWAVSYGLPNAVTALPPVEFNEDGVIMTCGASLFWEDNKTATFYCSFLAHESMDIAVHGSRGAIHVTDFIIPFAEDAATFTFSGRGGFGGEDGMHLGWETTPEDVRVELRIPQEALMVQEFATLVKGVWGGAAPERKWAEVSRKTQLLLDAVDKSIKLGYRPVEM